MSYLEPQHVKTYTVAALAGADRSHSKINSCPTRGEAGNTVVGTSVRVPALMLRLGLQLT